MKKVNTGLWAGAGLFFPLKSPPSLARACSRGKYSAEKNHFRESLEVSRYIETFISILIFLIDFDENVFFLDNIVA